MKRLLACLFVLGFLLSSCAPTVSNGDDTSPIKIGFVGPLTGDAAAYGVDPLNGVRMKIDEINASGGINGRLLEVIAEDGRCTGGDAASAAQKLVNVDKVVAIVGGECSSETLAMAPIVEAGKIVSMSPLSSSPDVTTAGEFIFRDYPSDALKTKAMAKYFRDNGYTKVAVISENTDFCTAFRDSLGDDIDGDFVFNESVDPGTKDYRSLVTRLKSVDFDVLVANGQFPSSIALMIQQMREQGMQQLVISHDVGQTVETITVGGEATEGMQAINIPFISEKTSFGSKFVSAYGSPQGAISYAAFGYDAMGVLAQAMMNVGTDGTAIRDYLSAMPDYDGIVGKFNFDKNGDVTGIHYQLYEVQNGEWVTLQDAPAM